MRLRQLVALTEILQLGAERGWVKSLAVHACSYTTKGRTMSHVQFAVGHLSCTLRLTEDHGAAITEALLGAITRAIKSQEASAPLVDAGEPDASSSTPPSPDVPPETPGTSATRRRLGPKLTPDDVRFIRVRRH